MLSLDVHDFVIINFVTFHMKEICLLGFLLFLSFVTMAQKRINFSVPKITNGADLHVKFKNYQLIKTDLESVFSKLKHELDGQVELAFSDQLRWTFDVTENTLLSSKYFETVASNNGLRKRINPTIKTFSGVLKGGQGKISLTVDHGFFTAVITEGAQTWYIEQAQHINGETDQEILLLYNTIDVIDSQLFRCGVEDDRNKANEFRLPDTGMRTFANSCKVVELAIASDASMFTKFGSSRAVFNHNIAVMNNVAVLYRHEFTDNIEFSIVTQYGSEGYTNDPLFPNTTSTSPGIVLSAFTAWGQTRNFGTTFDIGQFWTNRDFDGTTVGLAYLGTVCSSYKYHVLQDFSSNISSISVMTAHEIGHNFNASHDPPGSPTIMAPSVNMTSTWSSNSETDISNHITSRTCLSDCDGTVNPVFLAIPSAVCVGGTVKFKDKTINGSNRAWIFQSGSPSTSTEAQPAITYSNEGTYDVNLSGNGTANLFSDNYVIVNNPVLNTFSCPLPSGTPGNAGIKYFSLNSISMSSGNAVSDGDKYVNRSCTQITDLQTNTSYDVIASIGNYDRDVTPTLYERIKVYIDYDNDGLFNESNELIVNSDASWAGYLTYDPISRPWLRFSTPSSVTKNKILRLRVITDTSNPNSACYNTVDGQVEDYGVVFHDSNISLPVDLISFSGKKVNNYNLLEWKTVNETEMRSYTLEKSENGSGFSDVGTVWSNNTGKNQFNYQWKDDAISNYTGGYYYKLRMEELDGKVSFSKIIYIKNPDVKSGLTLQNCQTLIGENITYELVSDIDRPVNITLYNMMGSRVKNWKKILFKGNQPD